MSRVGKRPIPIPAGVEVKIDGQQVVAKGPVGELKCTLRDGIRATLEDRTIRVEDHLGGRMGRSLHGVSRTMIANAVEGAAREFSRALLIVGTGYRAQLRGRTLVLNVGYDNAVAYEVPEGVKVEVTERPLKVTITGVRKELVGQVAADIRAIRKPEPYRGKGIRYEDEEIRRKAGKSAG